MIKLRGITLNSKSAEVVTFEKFKEQVLQFAHIDPIFVDTSQFHLSKNGTIHTVFGKKKYVCVMSKGILTEDYTVLPFGFVTPKVSDCNGIDCSC